MANDLGKPESEQNDVPTADGTEPGATAPEAPASEHQTTTTPPNQPAEEPKVADVGDYEKRLQEAMAAPPSTGSGSSETQGKPAPETPPPTEEVQPPAPSSGSGPAAETPPTAPKADDPEDKIPDRIRLGGLSEKSRAKVAAATLLAKSEGIEIEEAFARINGAPTQSTVQPPATEEAPKRNAAEVDSEIAEQEKIRRQAVRDMDPDKQFEAEDRISDLRKEKRTIAQREEAQAVQAQTEFERQVDESQARAAKFYPAINDPNHAIHAKAKGIWDLMEKTGNPMISGFNAPEKVYQMAANELGIPPVDPDATPVAKEATGLPGGQALPSSLPVQVQKPASPSATPKPQAVEQTAVVRPTKAPSPASGAERTTPPGPTQRSNERIRTAAEYEERVAKLTATS